MATRYLPSSIRMNFLKFLFLCVILFALSCKASTNKKKALEKPNIIIILADDLGYGDPGCYNSDSKIPTPNIDRLAADGMLFTDAHSPSAVCTPTRYGLLTGRYSWRTRLQRGVLWGYSASLIDTNRTTIASMLKQHDYMTGCVGKWHLGLQNYDANRGEEQVDYSKPLKPGPNALGFDYFYGIPASLDMDPYLYVENEQLVGQLTDTIAGSERRRNNGGGFWRAGLISPGFKHIDVLPTITNKAIEFIQKCADKTKPGERPKPFFLYFPLTAPHTPWMPTDEFRGKSGAGYYGDFVAQVDWSVGQIIQTLERLQLSDNTIVFFTSDNGASWPVEDIEKWGHSANLNLRGQKADIWEGGHRIPFMARWPGHIKPGTISDETICQTDFLATIAAIVGYDLSNGEGEDSYNILPVLLDNKSESEAKGGIRDATVHQSSKGIFAIRQGDWKLIVGRGSGGFTKPQKIEPKPGEPIGQLYNLKDDLGEMNNLYLDNPEIVSRLSTLLEQYREQGYSRPLNFTR